MTTSINEVKYSILSNFNIFIQIFIADDEFIIAVSLSVNGGIKIF